MRTSTAIQISDGDNPDIGVTNESRYGFAAFHSHATVTVDRKPITEDGRLVA